MAPQKLVIKCGNVAVLVDVHALPLGAREEDTSWLTAEHLEEVAVLVQGAVEQRVKLHAERLHKPAKHRKELLPAKAFSATGTSFNLVANFLKRHYNLRCLVKDRYGELRVFPERGVVCVSRPEDASARPGNPNQAASERGEQSRSEYFSRVGGTQEPLNSSVKTKRSALQKMARHVGVRTEIRGAGSWGAVHTGDTAEGQGVKPWAGGHPGVMEDPGPGKPLGEVEHPVEGGHLEVGGGLGQHPEVGRNPGVGQHPEVGRNRGVGQHPAVGRNTGMGQHPEVGGHPGVAEHPGQHSEVVGNPGVVEGPGQHPKVVEHTGPGQHPKVVEHTGPGQHPKVVEHTGPGQHPMLVEHPEPESVPPEKVSSPAEISVPEQQTRLTSPVDPQVQVVEERRSRKRRNAPSEKEPRARPHGATASSSSSQQKLAQKTRGGKRAKAGSVTGEPLTPSAKRTCLGASPGASPPPQPAIAGSSQASGRDHLPPPPPPLPCPPPPSPPPPAVEAKAASTASPGPEETTGEAELLTPGKPASGLPVTSNGTAEQADQNRPAASLRGPSVRPPSPGTAISSRSPLRGQQGRENVARTSRMRRLRRT
ncbi:protein SLX4IP isoform X2 [Gadus macrocephalus]|uniref:protein SLX4IP isoform X2 n=1 Tax=Gadus macrocephalus TaxID=80720 RepID=UPI0028CBBDB2|nr:protein SLX4IP isoform X2 [Gadus macrocephalus]